MRWWFALSDEFFAGSDDANAEDGLPKSVRNHARSERVVFVDQPARESEPIHRRLRWQRWKRGGDALGDLVGDGAIIAAQLQVCFAPLVRPEFPVNGDGTRR